MRKGLSVALLLLTMWALLAIGKAQAFEENKNESKPQLSGYTARDLLRVDLQYNPPAEKFKEEITEEVTEEETPAYDNIELLAYCVEAEAGNQGLYGKQLVVDVILNRVDSANYPDTVEGVITQPYQFSVWGSGAIFKREPTQETYDAINLELEERTNSDIIYFNSIGFKYGTPWAQVGAHYFSY